MGDNNEKEEKHISEVLKVNGYPAHIIRSAQKPRGAKLEEETLKFYLFAIYVLGLSEDVRRVHVQEVLTLGQYLPQSPHLDSSSPKLKMLTLL